MLEELHPIAVAHIAALLAFVILALRHVLLRRRHAEAKAALRRVRIARDRAFEKLVSIRSGGASPARGRTQPYRSTTPKILENPGPASAGPELPNPAGLPGPAGVAAGSQSDSGTRPAGTGD